MLVSKNFTFKKILQASLKFLLISNYSGLFRYIKFFFSHTYIQTCITIPTLFIYKYCIDSMNLQITQQNLSKCSLYHKVQLPQNHSISTGDLLKSYTSLLLHEVITIESADTTASFLIFILIIITHHFGISLGSVQFSSSQINIISLKFFESILRFFLF